MNPFTKLIARNKWNAISLNYKQYRRKNGRVIYMHKYCQDEPFKCPVCFDKKMLSDLQFFEYGVFKCTNDNCKQTF